jgi:Gluconate 2-dehydrogenase subunit 3
MNTHEHESKAPTRRTLLRVIGAAPAAAAAMGAEAADQNAKPSASAAASAYHRKVFDDSQWRTVRALCDLILPADQHSGSATQAGVPEFIDDWLDFRKEQDGTDRLETEILGGLAWLDRESHRLFEKPFADTAAAQQKQILDRIAWPERAAAEDRRAVAFFSRFRDLTVGGFYSSKTGIADLPYLGNKPIMEWTGCDPEVWALIEARLKNGYRGLGGEVKPEAL